MGLLIDMKEKALGAADASLTSSQRSAFNEDFTALRDQIATIVSNAEFNGVNLINGSSTITVAVEAIGLSGSIVTLTSTAQLDTSPTLLLRLAQSRRHSTTSTRPSLASVQR